MTKTIYLVCGVPGSGKSWVARQLADRFHYIPHDRCWALGEKSVNTSPAGRDDDSRFKKGAKSNHLETLIATSKVAVNPIISECPYAERVLREGLEVAGLKVVPIFVVETPAVVAKRYFDREKKQIPQAAFTRASSIGERAAEWRAFAGTSDEVLKHLLEMSLEETTDPALHRSAA